MSEFYQDDPRLTAYVLGELSPAEAADVERLLADSAEAREAVNEIRLLTRELRNQLRAEPTPALTLAQRETIMSEHRKSTPQRQPSASGRGKNPSVIVATCLMIAAAGALIVFSDSSGPEPSGSPRSEQTPNADSLAANNPVTVDELASQKRPKSPPVAQRRGGFTGDGIVQLNIQDSVSRKSWGMRSELPSPSVSDPYSYAGRGGRRLAERESVTRQYRLEDLRQSKLGDKYFDDADRDRLGIKELRDLKRSKSRPTSESRILGPDERYGRGEPGYFGRPFAERGEGKPGEGKPGDGKRKPGQQGQGQAGGGQLGGSGEGRPGGDAVAEPDADQAERTPGSGQAGADPGKAAEATFQAKDVQKVREDVVKRFDQLAKANPKREIAILRVKERLAEKLTAVEQQVALVERNGGKVAPAEGRVIVGEVVKGELKGLDVDGDGRADFGNEQYDAIIENKYLTPLADPLSTFSIDVDTAAYSNTRRYLESGALPPRDAVRVEDFVNYFRYDYPQPKSEKDPFSVVLEAGVCPWNTKHQLVMIGLKGRELSHDKRPPANIVFLIDVSGSMSSSNKLPLVKLSLEMLVGQLQPKDRVSIVTYASGTQVVLESTPGSDKESILKAIHGLNAAGSTAGASGIKLAYEQAKKGFLEKGANRVVLCTDGDFNVGVSSDNDLVKLITSEAKSNVFLSVFGFGMGNLKNAKLEKIANHGNGHYGYIDGFNEAKKVFVEEMSGTLYTIAKDVKIQVEFNPAKVGSYRLLGYENRMLAAQDFNDDKKDAGEIGAGHTVTALYEIVPAESNEKPDVDELKYQQRKNVGNAAGEMLTVKLRYKQPDGDKSTKMEFPLKALGSEAVRNSNDFDFASAAAMYALLLRDSQHAGNANLDLVREIAAGAIGKDAEGHRGDFLRLVHQTRTLVARKLGQPVPAPRAFEAGKPAAK